MWEMEAGMGIHVTGVTDAPLYRMHQIVLPWRGWFGMA